MPIRHMASKLLDVEPATGPGAKPDVYHGLACLALVALAACSAPAPDESRWLDDLVLDRQLKDEQFREARDSPVPVERRGMLLPLNYFDPDPAYRVPAALEVSADQPIYDVPTSTGVLRPMQRVGILKFALNGEPMQLSAFVEAPVRSIETLFIPFKDPTNESETYAAGRYLEPLRTATGLYDLDFNRAFHPYCYYNEGYECPYPPPENRLASTIAAGERLAPGFAGFVGPGVVPPPADDEASAVGTPPTEP